MQYAIRIKKWAAGVSALFVQFAHGGFLIMGILAAIFMASRLASPGVAGGEGADNSLKSWLVAGGSAAPATPLEESSDTVAGIELSPEMRRVADYLSHKYRVAQPAIEPLVSASQEVGKRVGVDPMLILAVMAIESRFNPVAQSDVGAQGLMQVMPKYHQDKIEKYDASDAEHPLLDPRTNIEVGARVLKESIKYAGTVEGGLQQYSGGERTYPGRVMAERQRIEEAARRAGRRG